MTLGTAGCRMPGSRATGGHIAPDASTRSPFGTDGGIGQGTVGSTEISPTLAARVTACTARLGAVVPRELSAALAALDDDSLVTDACRLDVATEARAPELCAAVTVEALRFTCTARAAMAAGRPEACPDASGLRGHDPTCVAIAARQPRLCVAANVTDRGRCMALARGVPADCNNLEPLLRPPCARDLAALAHTLPTMPVGPLREGTAALLVTTTATASPNGGTVSTEGPPREYALRSFARGVLRSDDGALWLVDSTRGWPSQGTTADDGPLVGVRIPHPVPRTDLPADVRLFLPGGIALDTAWPTAHATARMTALPRGLGDPVRGVVTIDGTVGATIVHVVLDVDSFVRDVVPAARLR